jgi:membrane-bound lytic murein transglycosylase F
VRASRPLLLVIGLAVAVGAVLFAIWRAPVPLRAPDAMRELVVLIRPGPAVYYPGPDGAAAGFDVDLARQFAADKRLPLRFVLADSAAQVVTAIARGEAHIGAGGLYRPPAERDGDAPVAASATAGGGEGPGVLWTTAYASVAPVLIYNRDGYKPSTLHDLDGETVGFVEDAGFEREIAAIRAAHPGIRWQPLALSSPNALIAQVSDGVLGYAIVGSLAAALARNVYLDFEVAFAAGDRREMAWAVPPALAELRRELDRFLASRRRDGTLARLAERHMPDRRQIERVDAAMLQERMRTVLPDYRPLFGEAQEKTAIEWRLLAAIAYQESQWDPAATSETGVRGLMQITEDTARHLGIEDRLDPKASVLGAARYLRAIKDRLPARIQEPDRTWLALAAYNVGLGHLEDARIIARKQRLDPDAWSDVKKVLPLLAQPEYYAQARQGYARGGMPVAFVDRVRAYYDILLAQQPPQLPRLRMLADVPERASGGGGFMKR